MLDTLSLVDFVAKFKVESVSFLEKTRMSQWYKGIDSSSIISPFKRVLSSFGGIYNLVNTPEELKKKVHRLNEIIQFYDSAKKEEKTEANGLIIEITEILEQGVVHNRNII